MPFSGILKKERISTKKNSVSRMLFTETRYVSAPSAVPHSTKTAFCGRYVSSFESPAREKNSPSNSPDKRRLSRTNRAAEPLYSIMRNDKSKRIAAVIRLSA